MQLRPISDKHVQVRNAKGVTTLARYQLQPLAGAQFLTKEQVSTKGPDYLADEIRQRVGLGPIKFTLLVQVAAQDDKTDDPSIAWPDTRKKVELGTITITKPWKTVKQQKKSCSSSRVRWFLVSRRPIR